MTPEMYDRLYLQSGEVLDRLPKNDDLERIIIGAVFSDNTIMESITDILKPEMFFYSLYARLFHRMIEMHKAEKIITPVTIKTYFMNDKSFNEAGGPKILIQIMQDSFAYSLLDLRGICQQIRELAMLRGLFMLSQDVQNSCVDVSDDIDWLPIYQEFEDGVNHLHTDIQSDSTKSFSEINQENIEQAQKVMRGEIVKGLNIENMKDFNIVANSPPGGDLIVLAGRPGMGKTGVSCAIAGQAAKSGISTNYISIEMKAGQIGHRTIANLMWDRNEDGPNYSSLTKGNMTKEELRIVSRHTRELQDIPLTITDAAGFYIEDLLPHMKKENLKLEKKSKDPIKLLIIDYLGKIKTRAKFYSTNDRITYVTGILKEVSKKMDCVTIVLCQLSREVEKRDDKRPVLSDLRDSGSIEQEADTVIFLYREEYYLAQKRPPKNQEAKFETWKSQMFDCKNQLEIYSSKVREGSLQKRISYYNTSYQAIRDQNDMFDVENQDELEL